MDAIRLIKQDHRKVESLFEQFEALVGLPGNGRTRLIEEICNELTVHATIEEEVLYPVAKQRLEDGEEEVEHAKDEHNEIEALVERVRRADPSGTEVEQLMVELKDTVQHHVEEEESSFLPDFEERTAGERLEQLGAQLEQRKQQLLFEKQPVTSAASAMADGHGGSESLLDLTKEELYGRAQEADIPGRSKMTKQELADALNRSGG